MTFECLIQTALSSALFHRRCTALEEWIVVRILKSRCFFKNGFNLRAADSRAVIMLRDEVSTPNLNSDGRYVLRFGRLLIRMISLFNLYPL